MEQQDAGRIINDIAGRAMVLDRGDAGAIAEIQQRLKALDGGGVEWGDGGAEDCVPECIAACQGLESAESEQAWNTGLDRLLLGVTELEKSTRARGSASSVAASPVGAAGQEEDRYVRPEWVDETTLSEFLSERCALVDELDDMVLALEDGGEAATSALRRKIHTLKGDVGMLGFLEVEQVCHLIEDQLDVGGWSAARIDRLLPVTAWIDEALRAFSKGVHTKLSSDDVLLGLRYSRAQSMRPPPISALPDVESSCVEPSTQGSLQPAFDEDMIDVVEEFLRESDEGLTAIDEILLAVEQGQTDEEHINTIFRVFHTIKGISGFLELDEMTSLAHAVETLLNHVRQGVLRFAGDTIDVIFDATSMLRRMLESVKSAAEQRVGVESFEEASDLVVRVGLIEERAGLREAGAGSVKPILQTGLRQGVSLGLRAPAVPADIGVASVATRESAASEPGLVSGPVEAPSNGVDGGNDMRLSGRRESNPATDGDKDRGPKASIPKASIPKVSAGSKLKETVKVELVRVDGLVEMIGELVILESMIAHSPEIVGLGSPRVRNYLSQLTKISRDLQEIGMSMRMVPLRGVFQKMARMVRDLSRREGKEVRTRFSGEGTEMDRSMVENIADPLVHMIRNSVDHGLETAEERRASGKPDMGQITLSAHHQGGSVVIEVTDDGRGLDTERILTKARERGLVEPNETPTDNEIHNLIFAPGFSTAEKVTKLSGRGVGMDVVRRNIEELRGRASISSVQGQGSTIRMVLPLTMAIIDGMTVACGSERYIIPTLSIVESVRLNRGMVFSYAGRRSVVKVRDENIPLLRLDEIFEVKDAVADPTLAHAVILETAAGKMALVVDEVVAQQQVVIKNLEDDLYDSGFLSGAAILSDGLVGLILNVDKLCMLDPFKTVGSAA